jgi:hypothetical protein
LKRRALGAFRKCSSFFAKEECKEEQDNIMEICPTWAIESLREKKRHQTKCDAIDRNQYLRAMAVSDYN